MQLERLALEKSHFGNPVRWRDKQLWEEASKEIKNFKDFHLLEKGQIFYSTKKCNPKISEALQISKTNISTIFSNKFTS